MASVAPGLDPLRQGIRFGKAPLAQFVRQRADRHGNRHRRGFGATDQFLVNARGALGQCGQFLDQGRAIDQPVKPCDIVQRLASGKGVGLPVIDHLQAVFNLPQPIISLAQRDRVFGCDPASGGQHVERMAGPAHAQGGVSAAVDQLMGLRVEFDLADAAPPALHIEAGAGGGWALVAFTDPQGEGADFLDRAEIELAAPHEGADGGKEILARGHIARCRPRAGEGGAFPRQRGALVMGKGRADGDSQRADLACRAQPQVDPQGISIGRVRRQQRHDPPGIALRGIARIVRSAARQAFAVEQQDRIDVGRIIELACPLLAQRQRNEAFGTVEIGAFCNGGSDRAVQRPIGKGGEFAYHLR